MSHSQRFAELTKLLRQHEDYWRPSPFVHPTPAWCESAPQLAQACAALSDAALAELDADPAALQQWLQQRLPTLASLPSLLDCPKSVAAASVLPNHWSVDVPGRKWQQIAAFSGYVPAPTGTLLDWCSGKSHLGRTLAQLRQQPLRAVEHNARLCEEGAALAQQVGVTAAFVCADVLSEPVALAADSQVLALHACGDLHRRLLDQIAQQPVTALVLAPCCYHLWLQAAYRPLSSLAQQQDLQLDRNSVQLAVQEAVTSAERIRSRAAVLAAWRLGFDSLQRQLRKKDEYLTTPSLSQAVLQEGFEAVCRRIAAHKQLALPDGIDWQHFQQIGEQRYTRAKRLQVVRHGFRRALELWLVLDLVLFLEQLGYRVSLNQFCARELTPRNLLIVASKG